MLMPSIFGENLFDDFFGDFPFYYDDRAMKDAEKKLYGHKANHVMKTDIKEKKDKYVIDMDLPGYEKEDIKIEIQDGYLTVHAKANKAETDKEEGKYVRKERYYGECSRSFYVGEDVTEEDIKAKFKNGTLTLEVNKKDEPKQLPDKKYIDIE